MHTTSTEVFDGSATWTSRWTELATPLSLVTYVLAWTAVGSTSGTVTIEVTNDPSFASTSIITLTTALLTIWGTGFTPDANAGKTAVALEGLFRFVRMKYTRSAGGGAGQFSLFTFSGS